MEPPLTEDTLAPEVLIRYGPASVVDLREVGEVGRPRVNVRTGVVWARAEAGSVGVDLCYGGLSIRVRSGTLLFDTEGGTGLIIVLRGEAEVVPAGRPAHFARGGDAMTFDRGGRVGHPTPIDAPELARDPFVRLNVVLDALAGVPVRLLDQAADDAPDPGEAERSRPPTIGRPSHDRPRPSDGAPPLAPPRGADPYRPYGGNPRPHET